MRLIVCCLLLAAFLAFPAIAQDRDVIFSDDFSGYTDEASLALMWSPFSGHWFVQDGTLHQDNGDYDRGIVVRDLNLHCDYRFESRVRLVGGGAGAGMYWNVADQITGENGNMLRFDGNMPIMYGWMHGRGFLGTGGATGELMADGKWHDMRMDVSNSTGTFDFYWDGKKQADGAIEYHRSGYVGLECSMGHSEFDDVRITVAKGADWQSAPSGKVMPEWVSSVALLTNGDIVYTVPSMNRIQIVTPAGKLVKEFGRKGKGSGEMDFPSAVTTDKDDKIYVAETGNRRVQVFDSAGRLLKMIVPFGWPQLEHPSGIAVDPEGRVWVSDAGDNRVACLSDKGAAISFGAKAAGKKPGEFDGPRHISFIGGKLYVADTNNGRVQIFDPANPSAAPVVVDTPQVQPRAVNAGPKGTFVVSTGDGLVLYDKDWKEIRKFKGTIAGQVYAEQAVLDKNGNFVVADAWNKRVAIISPKLGESTPSVTRITSDSAQISWKSDLPTPNSMVLTGVAQGSALPSAVDYSAGKKEGDGGLTTEHKILLTGLKPAIRYTFAVVSPIQTIPAGGNSPDYRFSTEAPRGMIAYSEVPIAVLCYANVTFESQKDASGKFPEPAIRDEKWFQQNVRTHEAMRMFYLTNSRFRLDIQPKFLKIDRPVDFAFLGSSSEELSKDLSTLAAKEGLKPTDFGAVICIGGNCCFAYPWPTPWWGGKLTYTTGACFAGGGDLWLSTHEFHHLTEGWMGASGTRNYNSADMPWVHPGRFGENYDFLAHVNRTVSDQAYLTLAFGKLKATADNDGDSVPDDCPSMIWDEKRAGTDPNNKISYGNGLTDLQNLTAETMHPATRGLKHPMLTREINLKHPFAVFDYKYERPRKSQTIDGKFSAADWDFFVETPNAVFPPQPDSIYSTVSAPPEGADYRMKVYQNWDDDYLYWAVTAPFKFSVSIQVDGDGDGYFHGNDNIVTGFTIPRDDISPKPFTLGPTPGVMVWNCKSRVKETGGPDWTNDFYDVKDKIKWAWGKADNGWYALEYAMPKCRKCDFLPKAGKEMGVRFWIKGQLPPTEKDPDPGWVFEMFDSCEYGYFKLVK